MSKYIFDLDETLKAYMNDLQAFLRRPSVAESFGGGASGYAKATQASSELP